MKFISLPQTTVDRVECFNHYHKSHTVSRQFLHAAAALYTCAHTPCCTHTPSARPLHGTPHPRPTAALTESPERSCSFDGAPSSTSINPQPCPLRPTDPQRSAHQPLGGCHGAFFSDAAPSLAPHALSDVVLRHALLCVCSLSVSVGGGSVCGARALHSARMALFVRVRRCRLHVHLNTHLNAPPSQCPLAARTPASSRGRRVRPPAYHPRPSSSSCA